MSIPAILILDVAGILTENSPRFSVLLFLVRLVTRWRHVPITMEEEPGEGAR
jgi:hypothetical protein